MKKTLKPTQNKIPLMKRIAKLIVDFRYVIFLLFAAIAVFCLFSIGKVKINSDLTAFLPKDTDTRRGLVIMEEEFTDFTSFEIMVSNIPYETAQNICERIQKVDHVSSVAFDDTEAHYASSSALYSILLDISASDPASDAALSEIKAIVKPYDTYMYASILADYSDTLAKEMITILILAVIVVFAVLLLTSRCYFEVVIYGIVFLFAALLNMGTNYWLGTISSITNTIAVIMQLALAIDYAIIFAHRYQDAVPFFPTEQEALVEALSKSIVEISSSSLTTIAGLIALTLMQFRLGYDMGIVLAKGIVCSMLTVFFLMPGLILLFPKMLKRTEHKKLIPNIEFWGRFLAKTRVLFIVLFAVVVIPAIVLSGRVNYAFSDGAVDEIIYSENRAAMHKIDDTFTPVSSIVALVPAGDFDSEKAAIREIAALDEIKSVTGLASIRIDEEHVLTDGFNARMIAELLEIEIEQARLLLQAYGFEHQQYQPIFGSLAQYKVPLIDLLLYLLEKTDQGVITLNAAQSELLDSMRGQLETGNAQLRGRNWDRFVISASVPAEGEESIALVEKLQAITKKYYKDQETLVVGDITAARDLRASYSSDSILINILTILFVFLILLFTFRSFGASVILIFVIQGSIWINFACTWLSGMSCSFVTNMIVSAIQMGATIDYAIVITSRYLALRKTCPKKEAMVRAVNESFATVLTSGAIMTFAGLLIAFRISDVYVGHIGLAVGRGALISVILVLTVLPQLIVLLDSFIAKTTFRLQLLPKGGKDT